ncbi:hypothetical protein PC9H_008872 [Pleurotus ostreatus]|uniref:Uncharacterized protein n=1 Tax=Pleurotus ostreatus TaxID=5322 RepID=A0A8H6ZPM3_PLEOS|nr:uncharacterized protein PC9H_008872 [Pleurotus ostreatus]KAF7426503.1 hypothetical protein PC9H_008872 [Pleurotus ostreatus]
MAADRYQSRGTPLRHVNAGTPMSGTFLQVLFLDSFVRVLSRKFEPASGHEERGGDNVVYCWAALLSRQTVESVLMVENRNAMETRPAIAVRLTAISDDRGNDDKWDAMADPFMLPSTSTVRDRLRTQKGGRDRKSPARCRAIDQPQPASEGWDKVKTSQSGHDEILSASISAATSAASTVVASAFAARDAQTPAKSDAEKATLEQLMADWKKAVDGQWSSMRVMKRDAAVER